MSLMSDRFTSERLPTIKREKWDAFDAKFAVTQAQFKRLKTLPPSRRQLRDEYRRKREEVQNGLCDICGQYKKLSLDHNHTNEKYRSLLCATCNTLIGMAYESERTLIRAAKYLRFWRKAHAIESAPHS